ncbi:hypothetical protein VNI00_001181 [Paramarasmius palmivorus]|uniref:Alpha/beta hydrolase fold-3 domain-containing protein n=1 Tax=Paramarasmius palmivorus TaxID=297713 RepID=A0AAW0E815_9AGAR
MAEYSHLSESDPDFAVIAAHFPSVDESQPLSPAQRRQNYRDTILAALKATRSPPPDSEYQLTDRQIDAGDGAQILVRCVVPTRKAGETDFPLLFWTHGGGWVIGDTEWDDFKLRQLAVDMRIAVVNCEYRYVFGSLSGVIIQRDTFIPRLAPEHPFPIPVTDSFTCLKYFAAHPDLVSANLSKGFLVGGTSAGGNLAAVLSHLARDDPFFKDKPLTGQLLRIPVTLHPDAYPEEHKNALLSMEQNKDALVVNKKAMRDFWDLYNPDPFDPRASPVLLPSHTGLPPAYFQICGQDPLRDEGFLYEKLLRNAGVKTKVDVYKGVPHGFDIIAPNIPSGKKFEEDFDKGVRWLLQAAE